MYQTESTALTITSRSAGPVCSTRLAMRPAKSFRKNVQDSRTTFQRLCQRIRLLKPGLIAWLTSMACVATMQGRSTSTIRPMTASCGQASRSRPPGGTVATSPATRPMQIGIEASSSATNSPPTNSPAMGPRTCRA